MINIQIKVFSISGWPVLFIDLILAALWCGPDPGRPKAATSRRPRHCFGPLVIMTSPVVHHHQRGQSLHLFGRVCGTSRTASLDKPLLSSGRGDARILNFDSEDQGQPTPPESIEIAAVIVWHVVTRTASSLQRRKLPHFVCHPE
jgi:hypothetical protein